MNAQQCHQFNNDRSGILNHFIDQENLASTTMSQAHKFLKLISHTQTYIYIQIYTYTYIYMYTYIFYHIGISCARGGYQVIIVLLIYKHTLPVCFSMLYELKKGSQWKQV